MSTVTTAVDDGRIRVRDGGALRRRRLAVLLRALLVIPLVLVLSLWSVAVLVVLPVSWLSALLLGRVPAKLHRFLAAFFRYSGQASGWFHLLSGRYPDPKRTVEHPLAIEVPERRPQPRLVTVLRAPLAVPAIVLASVFRVVLTTAAVGAWFVALVLGRTTAGLQELGIFCLRYELETQAYLLLLTTRYPRLAPPSASPAPE